MNCTKNGVAIHFSHDHVYPGDEYTCPVCGNKVVFTDGKPIHVEDLSTWENVIDME
jgi:predicted RNA-binding Zn-ribbon protein involved in translation (DUF1610 family)